MFNTEKPGLDELPSSKQLLRSTILAGVVALALLLTVVLPAEYGIDPTGAGRILGLTEMGEIKRELALEAEDDHKTPDQSSGLWLPLLNLMVPTANAQTSDSASDQASDQTSDQATDNNNNVSGEWSDEVTFTLAPGEAAEIKLVMKDGDSAEYVWTAEGGRINFDLHAHGGGESASYEKGRGKTSGEGVINAAFDGNHGWFWRNRDKQDVTIAIKLRGDYSELLRE